MDSLKIIIATLAILAAGSLLTGCALWQKSPSQIENELRQAAGAEKNVELELTANRTEENVIVQILLKNPFEKSISSAQTWLSFNPKTLKGISVDVSKSIFTLTAPTENAFDNYNGILKLGRGSDHPITDKNIFVAELAFKAVGSGASMIHAYDYKSGLYGHSSVNTFYGGKPYNILKRPKKPLLVVQ